MRWFKHLVDSGDDPDVGAIINKFGPRGYYMFFRTLEIMSREFDVHHPGKNTFQFKWLLRRYNCKIGVKLLTDFFRFTSKLGRIKSRLNKDTIHLYCPKLKDLADEYTEKLLRKVGIESGQKSGQSREENKNKNQNKRESKKRDKIISPKKLKEFEKEFNEEWGKWPIESRAKKKISRMKFIALCKAGKYEEYLEIRRGYFAYLKMQYQKTGFEQRPVHVSTWLNNWEEEKDRYKGIKAKPSL